MGNIDGKTGKNELKKEKHKQANRNDSVIN